MLHYTVEGNGQEAIVFLHGFLENSKIWKNTVKALREDYTCICIDLPGHGLSDNTNPINTMEIMAEEVINTLKILPFASFTFIGHSMGGYVCLAIADIFPYLIKKIILVNSTTLPDSNEKKEQRLKSLPTIKRNYPLFVNLSIPLLFSDKLKPLLEDKMNELKNIALETKYEGIEAAIKGIRLRPDRTNIFYDAKFPILLINGIDDKAIDINLLTTIIPEKENIFVENLDCGHVAFMEKENEYISLLKEFLSK